ncbi:MAG: hypothetical protein ACPL28_02695 [bacterium]
MIIFLWLIFSQIEAKANLAKEFINKKLTIGDPFEIVVELSIPANKNISEPFIDSIEPFAIIGQKHKIIQEKGIAKHNYRFQISAFNTGDLKLPPLKFLLKEDSKTDTIQTNPVDIKILSVLPQDMKDINDIKEMVEFPNPLPLIILIIVISGGIIGFLGIRLLKKMKQRRIAEQQKIPCWERALSALEKLSAEDLITVRIVKQLYYTLSEILKRYLEERFGFPAIEQTTTEIVQSMKTLNTPLRDEFKNIFNYADMVKYAKFVPPTEETKSILRQSKELITKTIPQQTEEAKQ